MSVSVYVSVLIQRFEQRKSILRTKIHPGTHQDACRQPLFAETQGKEIMGAAEEDWRRRKHLFRHGGLYIGLCRAAGSTEPKWGGEDVDFTSWKENYRDKILMVKHARQTLMCNTVHKKKLTEQNNTIKCHYPNTVWQPSSSSSPVRCSESEVTLRHFLRIYFRMANQIPIGEKHRG